MCGIFGLLTANEAFSIRETRAMTDRLFCLSETRGKESAGLAVLRQDSILVCKQAVKASKMIHSRAYRSLFDQLGKNASANGRRHGKTQAPLVLMGHSRLVTNGSQTIYDNNQPVIRDGLIGIHNGIIVNDERLWQNFPELQRHYEVDTEVILALIRHFYNETGSFLEATQRAFSHLEGTASLAIFCQDLNIMTLVTNNGSLYFSSDGEKRLHFFASEEYILKRFLTNGPQRKMLGGLSIRQVKPGTGLMIDVSDLTLEPFSLESSLAPRFIKETFTPGRKILHLSGPKEDAATGAWPTLTTIPEQVFKPFEIDPAPIQALKRCSRCVLPETMPFIDFDGEGVCNYCRTYAKHQLRGYEALLADIESYRRTDGQPECLVTFSGGRDSSYGLHYVTRVLELKPLAYTYDWGMITDLARRNQARLCGKLRVEQLLISADITTKRRYIRQNVTAWLKRPHLGTVPLFMAGDKQYFYHANRLRRQTGVRLIVLAANPFEKTHFKAGFCGVAPTTGHIPETYRQIHLAAFYLREFLCNPGYLNSSLPNTISSFISYYLIPHDYLRLYNYIPWDEETISVTLRDGYDWETAEDTSTTWRIGDGTASFYNYVYYHCAGFTENDTFRSNQIREGQLTRERALEIVQNENQPRFDSINWYCETIGIDIIEALKRIVQMPTLYDRQ
jgi:glucosamine--fructose-6-phosphate aminotransferase (isomerizing)